MRDLGPTLRRALSHKASNRAEAGSRSFCDSRDFGGLENVLAADGSVGARTHDLCYVDTFFFSETAGLWRDLRRPGTLTQRDSRLAVALGFPGGPRRRGC